jgi:hypothetical protein
MKRLLAWIVPAKTWDGFLFDRRTFVVVLVSDGYMTYGLMNLPGASTLPSDVIMHVYEK